MNVTRISGFTRKTQTLDLPITQEQLDAYHNGASIQSAFPDLQPSLREFIMTGVTPAEWDQSFGKGSCARNDARWLRSKEPV